MQTTFVMAVLGRDSISLSINRDVIIHAIFFDPLYTYIVFLNLLRDIKVN